MTEARVKLRILPADERASFLAGSRSSACA